MPKGISSLRPRFELGALILRPERAACATSKEHRLAGARSRQADAAASQTARAVMTGDKVVRILDETVDWYRMLGIQQQAATQPSDLLILYANRQTAEKVMALAFEIARANAELLSSEAEAEASEGASVLAKLRCKRKKLDSERASIQAEIALRKRELADAPRGRVHDLQAQISCSRASSTS